MNAPKTDYRVLYSDPRWQQKRLEVLKRDGFKCQQCDETTKTLNVHHRYYIARRMPWEYPDFCFLTLCDNCHETETNAPQDSRSEGQKPELEWETALAYFGDNIFDLFVTDGMGRLMANHRKLGPITISFSAKTPRKEFSGI